MCIVLLLAFKDGFSQQFSHVPGTVVHYQPASTQKYIGSPSLVILPNGDYVASHDFFWSTEFRMATGGNDSL